MTMRGQISLELLVTFGILLAFTVPIIILMLTVSQYGYEDAARAQANAVSKTIADSINEVYTQGPYAQRVLSVALPSNTESLRIADNEVTLTLRTSTGVYEASSPFFAKVEPRLITGSIGLTRIVLEVDSQSAGQPVIIKS